MFYENTYIIYDETNECVIVDPGCHNDNEKSRLVRWISQKGLRPVRLVNTHCHLDHVFGNAFVAETYKLPLEIHAGELEVLNRFEISAQRFGITRYELSPKPASYLSENDKLTFGNTSLDILLTPGHSPASICFYSPKDNFIVSGDVLFERSIGRTDLPGGNYDTLINSIKTKLMTLPDETIVYSGHGNPTTIGNERYGNPFLR
jgi:glyoxylase-like metal-dependent hydrolase (beta-lactamase superfamily II)